MSHRIRNRVRPYLINLTLLAVSTIIALSVGEILLRMFEPVEMRLQGNQIHLTTNHALIIENNKIDKLDRQIRQTRNSIGFRGENPPLNFKQTLTLLAVGGSTTECYYLSDGETWPEVLGNALKASFSPIWINNAGLDGHSTYGHTYLMRDYIAAIRPQVVLFLIGVNDIGLDKSSPYDDFFLNASKNARDSSREKPSLWSAIRHRHQILSTLAEYSYVVNLALNIGRSIMASKGGLGHGQVNFARLASLPMTDTQKRDDLEKHRIEYLPLFQERLVKLVELTRSLDIEPILITQPAMWGYGVDPVTGSDLGPASAFFWDRLELYNDVTRQVGKQRSIPVIDLASEMPKLSTYYYDWFHFSPAGAAKVAEIVATGLTPILATEYPDFRRSAQLGR